MQNILIQMCLIIIIPALDQTTLIHHPKYNLLKVERIKAGSQSDASRCVALIRETHKFITQKVGGP